MSPKQKELARLLCDECLSAKMAADVLKVSVKTIDTRRQTLYQKLDINSTAQLCKIYWTTDILKEPSRQLELFNVI